MRDLDSAVGRLDNIFMTIYFFVVLLIFAVALVWFAVLFTRAAPLTLFFTSQEAQLLTLVTSAGTFVLGTVQSSMGDALWDAEFTSM